MLIPLALLLSPRLYFDIILCQGAFGLKSIKGVTPEHQIGNCPPQDSAGYALISHHSELDFSFSFLFCC